MKSLIRFLNFFLDLNFAFKRIIFFIIDIFCFIFAFFITGWFVYDIYPLNSFLSNNLWFCQAIILIGLPYYSFTGYYREVTRFINSPFSFKQLKKNAILVTIVFFVGLLLKFKIPSIKFICLFWIFLSFLNGEIKFLIRNIILYLKNYKTNTKSIAIYGAGVAGSELAASLRHDRGIKINYFFDDDKRLWGRTIQGAKIISFDEIKNKSSEIDQVLLAMPRVKKEARKIIINRLESLDISVLQIPSLEDIFSGKAKIDDLRQIKVEDLLSREKINANKKLISDCIMGKSICVTGAGGSIGSEILKQILKFNPSKIILIERNEPSLYNISEDVKKLIKKETKLISFLGCAQNKLFIKQIFKNNSIDSVFHCAAYKHVPIVEANPIEGIKNNIISTKNLCEASEEFGIGKFILISSDKAVRPTNIMGASKRVCELITFRFAEIQKRKKNNLSTKFSIVRFGNVLESSGSVVPLFRKQIENGGPITLTHKKVMRYFMTITEAAQLVIQAASLSNGGELFLLDMGDPVNIFDLAKRMIKLSGKTVKSEDNKNGDIEIITTGLRPGEKLYEELLINPEATPTKNPLIFQGKNEIDSIENFDDYLNILEDSLHINEKKSIMNTLSTLVPSWEKSNK